MVIAVKKKQTDMLNRGAKGFDVTVIVILSIVTLIILMPLVYILANSFSSPEYVFNGSVFLWPKGFTFSNYMMVFKEASIMRGYFNTIIYTLIGTALSLIMTFGAAYALSRNDLRGKKVIMMFFTITMFVSGGIIPTFIVVDGLRLTNTIWGFILPGSLSVWNVIVVRTYMKTAISFELQESAKMDGASDIVVFFRIVLPLSMPIIAIMVLFYAVGYWNSYFNGLMYLTDEKLYPLQMVLNKLIIQNDFSSIAGAGGVQGGMDSQGKVAEALKYTTIVVSSAPILILYPFLQRFFAKGLMVGSIKG